MRKTLSPRPVTLLPEVSQRATTGDLLPTNSLPVPPLYSIICQVEFVSASTLPARTADSLAAIPPTKQNITMKTLLNMLLATAMVPAMSQNSRDYIIGKHNDTLLVQFYIPLDVMPYGDSVWFSEKAIIIERSRVKKFLPSDLAGFCYNGDYYESVWWATDIGDGPPIITRKFCKQILSGAIPVFSCHSITSNENGDKRLTTDLYYKEDESYKKVVLPDFDGAGSKLLSYCPQFSERIRNGNLNREDFLVLVKSYNKYLEPKTSH